MNSRSNMYCCFRSVIFSHAFSIIVLLGLMPSLEARDANGSRATTSSVPKAMQIKVLVLNYDPFYDGRRLHDVLRFNDPRQLAEGYKKDIEAASGGFVTFKIVEWRDLDEIYARQDGGRYTVEEYVRNRKSGTGWPKEIVADYPRLLAEQDVVTLIDEEVVDEVWIFGDHYFGLWEASMAGPGAFFINGGVYPQIASKRPFAFYGFNYERGVAEMLHNTAHRTEATMNRIYGEWNLKKPQNNWEKFSANASQSNGVAGVGTCHWPANAKSDYDYGNAREVDSWADDFLNYPNLTGKKTRVSSKSWSPSGDDPHRGYMNWYFTRLPKSEGINPDGKLNNWWVYIYAFASYQKDGKPSVLQPTLSATATPQEIATWVISSGGRIGLRGSDQWIDDLARVPKDEGQTITKISFFPISKQDTQIRIGDLAALSTLSNLEELVLRGQMVGDAGARIVAQMQQLKVLNLHACGLSDTSLSDLSKMKNLEKLDVGYSNKRITDIGAKQLVNLDRLTELNIYDSKITDETLVDILGKLRSLRTVEVTATQVTAEGIEQFKRIKPNCKVIKYD